MHQLKTEHWLPINISEAWSFFSSPQNLSKITPPEMDFKIISDLEDDIYEGMLIDYKVKPMLGISVNWQTMIANVEIGKCFIDKQLKGPYKVWEHKHTFAESKGGVLIKDEVNYLLPFSILGTIAHQLFVKRKIESIFEYRKNVLDKIFTK